MKEVDMYYTDILVYRSGLKYQLAEESRIKLPFKPPKDIITDFVSFLSDGTLINAIGYAWDGPSGPAMDDDHNMGPSLVHDSGYQLLRLGLLPQSYKHLFDMEYKRLCIANEMSEERAEIEYLAISEFGGPFARKQKEKLCKSPLKGGM